MNRYGTGAKEFISLLQNLYRDVNFDDNIPLNMIRSIENRGFASALSLIHAVKRKYGSDCKRILLDILRSLQKYFNVNRLICVDDISKFGDPGESVKQIKLEDITNSEFDCSYFLKRRGVIIVSDKFRKRLSALSTIFDSLWDEGSRFLPVLAWDKSGLLWDIIEGELLNLSELSPPVISFLPYFHAFKYYGDHFKGLQDLDKEVREAGLLNRVWTPSRIYSKKIQSLISELSKFRMFSHFLTALIATLRGDLSIKDLYVYLLYIMGGNEDAKLKILLKSGLFPSEYLKNLIEKDECERIDECIEEIKEALIEAEKKWFPEISLEEILNIPYGGTVDNVAVEEWLRDFHSKIINTKNFYIRSEERVLPSLIPSIKLAISLLMSKISFESQSLTLLVRYLISLSNRLRYIAIPIISNAIKAISSLSEEELEFAIYLQRFLEIHGPKAYLTLSRDVFGDKFIYVVYLGLLINSKRGLGARKIIAYTLKSQKVASIISKHLGCLRSFKVRGFTIPIPWELEVGASGRRIEWVKSTINYFKEVGLNPPEQIILLDNILSFRFNKEQIEQNINKYSLRTLVDLIGEISKLGSFIDKLKTFIVEQFGVTDVKFVRSAEAMLTDIMNRLYKAFERRYIIDYNKILGEEKFVSNTLDMAIKKFQNRPIILVVVDGLRLDDYLTKVREKLSERHLKVVYEDVLFSYLPSITTYSRRAIFSGETPPKYLLFPGKIVGVKLVKEGAYLPKRFKRHIYLKGSIGEIQIKLQNMLYSGLLKGMDIVAIVLSDLEKAAHGSAEGFLARLTMDYADEIAKVIQTAISVYYQVNKKIPIAILASDHGLEKFTKIVEVEPKNIINLAKNRRFLDPAFEIVITPRYIIIPTLSNESAKRLIMEIERNYKAQLWLKSVKELGIDKIAMKLKEDSIYNLVDGERVIILFPRGDKRFKVGPTRSVVYHGGPLPSEVLTPFVAIEPE